MTANAPAPDASDGARHWRPAPAGLVLREHEVHVWRADLDRPGRPIAQLADSLSADERRRADAYLFPRDRRRYIASRGLLRWLIAGYLDCEPGAITLRYGPKGKPELATPSGSPPVRFNCSHSQGRVLYALTRGRRIGVDLEALRPLPEAERIARQWFLPGERAALAALPPEQREDAFLRGWTSKEACAKAMGEGLAGALGRIEVSLAAGGTSTLRAIDGDPREAAHWSLRAPPPIPGCVAALVVEEHRYRLGCWSLDAPLRSHHWTE